MHYIGSSSELGVYIIGQTQYSQYFRADNHFKNAIARLGYTKDQFDFFEIYSIPGEAEKFNEKIIELDKDGLVPLNTSLKYIQLLVEITNNKDIINKASEQSKKIVNRAASGSKKKAYGEYSRVLLTDKQYKNLCDDFTKVVVDQVIPYLDEYIESNNNKNHYTNFYIVMKRAIREDWYNLRLQQKEAKREAHAEEPELPEEVKDFLNKIK